MDQRTRTLAPWLTKFSATADQERRETATLLDAASRTAVGETLTIAGRAYRRVPRGYYSDDAYPSVEDLNTGAVVRLHRAEEKAFWSWAIIEVLRLTGMRIEELLELTHTAIRRYLQPGGEVTPLLQVAPSKTDRERVIPVSPELSSVLAVIIRRVKGPDGTLPLISRYDGLERTWGPKLPHLFQVRMGGPPRVLSKAGAHGLMQAVAEKANLRDVDGIPLTFSPHDLRRIFATETVNSGLPIHIAQQLLGHINLNTTQGYVAVYPEQVIRNYRTFIDRRRSLRPSLEYRDPLPRNGPTSRTTSRSGASRSVHAIAPTGHPASTSTPASAVPCLRLNRDKFPVCRIWKATHWNASKRPNRKHGWEKSRPWRSHCAISAKNGHRQLASADASTTALNSPKNRTPSGRKHRLFRGAGTERVGAVKSELFDVEKQQIDVVVVALDIEMNLSANE
ncbi:tyrosine-type recombinase/integrase [Arthrobacter sp. TS-15]|uniref:tyrosine-type recombinase/integrase n=1 Tax=Arthrobacter sp. TS-15 TaxID=2510797 RepID=UPI00237BB029|nr:tyrosine-type recombinase/integrase [Arthrobacter sp. TS-15]